MCVCPLADECQKACRINVLTAISRRLTLAPFMINTEVYMFPAEAYAVTRGSTIVIQLVSKAARSIPELQNYDDNGVVVIPVEEAEPTFTLMEKAGVGLSVLG
jgi:hypothetical protein